MQLSESQLLRLAKLARLNVSPTALPKMAQSLEQILNAFEELQTVSTEGVQPLFHLKDHMECVADEPQAPLSPEQVVQHAKGTVDGMFRVPRVVGGS
jgi:aspartyl-tRNA(Asn)/glutamyl-tRNA(Gln) amidotransferase subunit C